ncbi:MAG TPA: hypothetical protein VFO62_05925 [Candidatus Binatia bacterium]|nr:hypothetical protein [Candidatus Binatia bacterium]
MIDQGTQAKVSFPFFGILQLVLITLKLAQVGLVANWSWWLVMSPTLVALGVVGLLVTIAVIIAVARS